MTGWPVLRLDEPGPDGSPNPLLMGAPETVTIPAGGQPLRLLRTWDRVRHVTTSQHFAMAGAVCRDGHRVTRGHPLTGAEMQHPDGGLLNMDGPVHRHMRALTDPLMRPRNLDVGAPQLAAELAVLAAGPGVDIAALARTYAAVLSTRALGVPYTDRPLLERHGAFAFGAVHGPGDAGRAAAIWEESYNHWQRVCRTPGHGLARDSYAVLTRAGYSTPQAVRVIATIANGFTAVAPALTVCLVDLAGRPRDGTTWRQAVARSTGRRAMFPVALPRVALERARAGGQDVEAGSLWLPVLIAAAAGGAPLSVAFGSGPHRCPGAGLHIQWAAEFCAAVLAAHPAGRFSKPKWQAGTLATPTVLRWQM